MPGFGQGGNPCATESAMGRVRAGTDEQAERMSAVNVVIDIAVAQDMAARPTEQ
jgi:hypothetical protein